VKQLGLMAKFKRRILPLSFNDNFANCKDLQVGTFDTRITIPEGNRAEEIGR